MLGAWALEHPPHTQLGGLAEPPADSVASSVLKPEFLRVSTSQNTSED